MVSSTPTVQTLSGKVAVVSGSCSGIGAATARELARRGASVAINYPSQNEAEAAQQVLQSLATSEKSIAVEADISTWTGGKDLIAAAAEKFGKIDILVNNAAHSSRITVDTPDSEIWQKEWDITVNTNARGPYLLVRAVLPYLTKSGARIINISSDTARDPIPLSSLYSGAKAMLESFTRSWVTELSRKYSCTVNTISPGPIATEVFQNQPADLVAELEAFLEKTPAAARLGETDEVAWVVAILAEDRASWINGQRISVNGGSRMF